jgi:hypothetical protein
MVFVVIQQTCVCVLWACVMQTLRRLWRNQHRFAEHEERVLRLDQFSAAVVNHVIQYCFRLYLESYAVFQPLDKAVPPPPASTSSSASSLTSTATNTTTIADLSLSGSAVAAGALDSEHEVDQAETTTALDGTPEWHLSVPHAPAPMESEPPFVLPNIVLQYPLPATDAYAVFLAAHYLHIPPLLHLAASYISRYLDRT